MKSVVPTDWDGSALRPANSSSARGFFGTDAGLPSVTASSSCRLTCAIFAGSIKALGIQVPSQVR